MSRGELLIAVLIVLAATSVYLVGFIEGMSKSVEPQSVFTLYGAVLGYLFGKRRTS